MKRVEWALGRKCQRTTGTLALLTVAAVSSLAADKPFQVSVRVDGPSGTESRLESAILVELRKHADVSIVETDPDYSLSVACLEVDGVGLMACSSVAVELHSLDILKLVYPALQKEKDWSMIEDDMKALGRVVGQNVTTSSAAKPDDMAALIVAAFDTKVLEPARRTAAELERYTEGKKKPR